MWFSSWKQDELKIHCFLNIAFPCWELLLLPQSCCMITTGRRGVQETILWCYTESRWNWNDFPFFFPQEMRHKGLQLIVHYLCWWGQERCPVCAGVWVDVHNTPVALCWAHPVLGWSHCALPSLCKPLQSWRWLCIPPSLREEMLKDKKPS